MIAIDEDALICDFAETYGVFDYKGLPVKTLAALAVGLRKNSRIKMKIRNEKVDMKTILLAAIADRLGLLVWFKSEDGAKNQNRPKSILESLQEQNSEDNACVFESGEAFKKEWERLAGEG